MKYQRYAMLLVLFSLFSTCLFAQGLSTTASKEDWEEINYEFNSPILTDGYPSLLRLADLLKQNPGYKVKLEGHADVIGSNAYNQRLGQRRADAVREFLIKYGANASQLTATSFGETQPKINDRSKEARFMNRRVFMTVTDEQGRVIGEGGISDTLKMLKDLMAAQQKCCDEILRRLDKLDQIADMLKKITGDNDQLRKELGDLRKAHDALDQYVKAQPKPLTAAETSQIVDTRTAEQIEKARMPRFSIVGINAGADQNGELTFSGRGRLFLPFKEQFAVQMQGEYMYFKDRQEGQADIGLVNRFHSRAQAGIFASMKNVNFSGRTPGRSLFTDRPVSEINTGALNGNGTLGQASFMLDYLFSRGKVGIFGSKAFMNDAVIAQNSLARNVFTQYYIKVVDQVGAQTTLGMWNNNYFEGNIGYLKSAMNSNGKAGGTARFIFPLSDRFAFTLEGGFNETMLTRDNNGRVVAGFQFGNFMRPKDYLEGYNGIRHAVPMDVPRVRYELLTRTVRTGNDAPVANAGADQIGVQAGNITLDGSGSFDPEGDALTYQWSQVSGPSVSISGMNTARATFTAAEGQSYGFRLVVKDPQNLQSVDSVTVTTAAPQQVAPVQIVRFQAVPTNIRSGEQSMLDWQVIGADSVTISNGIGTVPANGQRAVSPTQSTTYTLTARNARGEVTAIARVIVEEQPLAQFLACTASPATITAGEASTVSWSTANADSVNISNGIGAVDRAGSRTVTPAATTTYTLTATNARGPVSCTATVTVNPGTPVVQPPRIISFAANPTTITVGQSSTLTWNVENADTVDITGLGEVPASGSRAVSPNTSVTYVITARNRGGVVQANAPITVNPDTTTPPVQPTPAPVIGGCQATPTTSTTAGGNVVINYFTTNATRVTFSPAVAGAGLNGPITVAPTATTSYTLTATGTENRTATCTVSVNVTPAPAPPTAVITGPATIQTIRRETTLDATGSTNPAGGALTYIWSPVGTGATVLDQGQPITRVQFSGQFGDYVFNLTVRNALGQQATTTVTVRFISTTVP
ncbi:MAG: OmpA family protein [Bryobacteraceae bacterium]|nr:OmpA family protein [Bryobacteraceae bacterium]